MITKGVFISKRRRTSEVEKWLVSKNAEKDLITIKFIRNLFLYRILSI